MCRIQPIGGLATIDFHQKLNIKYKFVTIKTKSRNFVSVEYKENKVLTAKDFFEYDDGKENELQCGLKKTCQNEGDELRNDFVKVIGSSPLVFQPKSSVV